MCASWWRGRRRNARGLCPLEGKAPIYHLLRGSMISICSLQRRSSAVVVPLAPLLLAGSRQPPTQEDPWEPPAACAAWRSCTHGSVSAPGLRNPEDWPLLEAYLQFAKSPWQAERGIFVQRTPFPSVCLVNTEQPVILKSWSAVKPENDRCPLW